MTRNNASARKRKTEVLVLFANPPDKRPIRLDREDRAIVEIAKRFSETVTVERQHASELEDFQKLLSTNTYDIVHFSGHGDQEGIYLDRGDISAGQFVSAERLKNILDLAKRTPLLVVLLCCYSESHLPVLKACAPFVITARDLVPNPACIIFSAGLYEWLFAGHSIEEAYNHACHLLAAKGHSSESFNLTRGRLQEGYTVECTPSGRFSNNTIVVNLADVHDSLNSFGMSQEELLHQISHKLTIHSWIFDQPRERAMIPIGKLLFGVFSWRNAQDVVRCDRLMRLSSGVPIEQWKIWAHLLSTYNDLAAAEYRNAANPGEAGCQYVLQRSVKVFRLYLNKYLVPAQETIERLGFKDALPHIELTIAEVDQAEDQLALKGYPHVVKALEMALTNYHEIVDMLQPAECPPGTA